MTPAWTGVVVTGIGVCTPLGRDVARTWPRLVAGESALDDAHGAHLATEAVAACAAAAEPPSLRVPKHAKYAGRAVTCALHAVHEATTAAAIEAGTVAPRRLAVHAATGQTGLDVEEFFPALSAAWDDDPSLDFARLGGRPSRLVDPYFSLRTLANGGLALVAAELGAQGPSTNYVQGELAGAHALRAACLDLHEGRADAAVVFACDSLLQPSARIACERRGLLAGRSNGPAPRPFGRTRHGLVPGEGAAALVLERASDAQARGVTALAGILDVRVACGGAATLWSAGAAGLQALLPFLLRAVRAGLVALDGTIDEPVPSLVIARGLGTREHDVAEALALAGGLTPGVHVTATKGATGYLGAASGLADVVIAVRALQEGIVPPVAGQVDPDPAAPPGLVLQPVRLRAGPRTTSALALSAGWGDEWAGIALTRGVTSGAGC